MKSKFSSVLILGGLLAVLAACQDSPTVPGSARIRATESTRSSGLHLGELPFYCTLGRYAPSLPSRWQTQYATLFFPSGELDERGRTVRYDYRRSSPDGRLLSAASCVVPYGERALRRVDRAFGIKDGGGAEQFRARQEMVTTQGGGCVTSPDGVCPVDPIIVIAPPKDRSKEVQCGAMDPNCGSGGGDGGWGDGSWGGGGDGAGETPSDPQDTPSDTTCNTTDPIVNSAAVQTAFEDLWKRSNYEVNGAIQPQEDRREQGGFILSSAAGYTFQPFPSAWTSGACSIGVPEDARPPAGAVAWVHTHPFAKDELMSICGELIPGSGIPEKYNGNSSWGDNDTSAAWGLPGYLIDANDISKFTDDKAAEDVSLGRCAY